MIQVSKTDMAEYEAHGLYIEKNHKGGDIMFDPSWVQQAMMDWMLLNFHPGILEVIETEQALLASEAHDEGDEELAEQIRTTDPIVPAFKKSTKVTIADESVIWDGKTVKDSLSKHRLADGVVTVGKNFIKLKTTELTRQHQLLLSKFRDRNTPATGSQPRFRPSRRRLLPE